MRYLHVSVAQQLDAIVNRDQQGSVTHFVQFSGVWVSAEHAGKKNVKVLLPVGRACVHASDGLPKVTQELQALFRP